MSFFSLLPMRWSFLSSGTTRLTFPPLGPQPPPKKALPIVSAQLILNELVIEERLNPE